MSDKVIAALAAEVNSLHDRLEAAERSAKVAALRSQRDFFLAIDMDAAADHCEQAAIAYEADAVDADEDLD